MAKNLEEVVRQACGACNNDRTRMMDIVLAVQQELGHVPERAMDLIADAVDAHRVEVEGLVSFYAFLSSRPKGKVVIRLCNDIIDQLQGQARVRAAFEEALGIKVGQTTTDGAITLEEAPFMGLGDQAPAALVNDVPIINLTTDKARQIVAELKKDLDPRKLVKTYGGGVNAHPLVQAEVYNNLKKRGPVVFEPLERGVALKAALALNPAEVIRNVKTARLRGRGGAGFPTGMKWEFTRNAEGTRRFVVCNADEGEPGTFKDRVILTEAADLMFEGMAIAGYAIGADTGILYLRGEYAYLRAYLEHVLAERRKDNLLGKSILGKAGFDFDVRIQMGAGAYICGEETALLSSAEGTRGDPKNRPPFPAQKGYLGHPTSVNNVETFCCVARICEKGAAWFGALGSKGSSGTKLLSISGDCKSPGVYELPFGVTVSELLKLVGAEDAAAVQVGGASGQMIGPKDFGRTICYDDLATGGSIMVFNQERDLLEVAQAFMEFFVEESCGYCTPCRVGNVLLKERLERIRAGHGVPADLAYLEDLADTVKSASRCGLGQTSHNPISTTLKNFRPLYERLVKDNPSGLQPHFDLKAAVALAERVQGRASVAHATGH